MGLLSGLAAAGGFLGKAAAGVASSVAGPLISGLFGSRDTDKTNETNRDIANENLKFQRENLDYQKALQEKIFQREDSSYQRTVADMRAAGLSPLAMNGTNGAGEALQVAAPVNSYSRQGKDYSWISDATNKGVNAAIELSRLKNESDQSQANVEKTEAETANILANTDFFNLSAGLRLQGLMHQNNLSAAQYNKIIADTVYSRLQSVGQALSNHSAADILRYNRYFGINPQMSEKERFASLVMKISGFDGGLSSVDGKSIIKSLSSLLGGESSSPLAGTSFYKFLEGLDPNSPKHESTGSAPKKEAPKRDSAGNYNYKGLSPAQRRAAASRSRK